MTDTSLSHPAPHHSRVSFAALMFGACVAPIFWIGQELLGYIVSSEACYGSNHPTSIHSITFLRTLLLVFDGIAIIAAVAGFITSYICWRAVRHEKEGGHQSVFDIGDGRARFMALWGIMSSIWFFNAILFETIASAMVPLCP